MDGSVFDVLRNCILNATNVWKRASAFWKIVVSVKLFSSDIDIVKVWIHQQVYPIALKVVSILASHVPGVPKKVHCYFLGKRLGKCLSLHPLYYIM